MKTNKLSKPQHSLIRLLYHPHFQGAVIITAIILLLFLAGCSSGNPSRFYSKSKYDCDQLMKKRFSHAKLGGQPKIKNGYSTNKRIGALAKMGEGAVQYPIKDSLNSSAPTTATSIFQPFLDSNPFSNVNPENPFISKNSREFFQRTPEKKLIDELPQPASPFSKESDHDDISILLYSLMLAGPLAVSLLLLSAFTQTSMRASAWGAHHPIASKIILGGVHIGTGLTGLVAGSYLGEQQLLIPDELIAGAVGVFVATSMLYPTSQKSLSSFSSSYRKQKFCDTLLYITGIALFLSAGNQLSQPERSMTPQMYQGITEYRPINTFVSPREIERNKDSPQDPVEKKNGKITLTILASLFFTAGVLFVAAVSCSLSCSGAGTGAVLVAVLGGTGFILAYVGMLKNIKKKYKVKRKKTEGSVASVSKSM